MAGHLGAIVVVFWNLRIHADARRHSFLQDRQTEFAHALDPGMASSPDTRMFPEICILGHKGSRPL